MKLIKKLVAMSIMTVVVSLTVVGGASAHVVVTPNEVVTATRTTFAVSVPNEHDTPVVSVRLVIPEGLSSVRPHAKAGWNVQVTATGEGENTSATEITWTGGQIPIDLKDEFLFGAKVPAGATELKWKAYETYANGLVVAWEQEPSENEDNKPYSVTKIVNETAVQTAQKELEKATKNASRKADRALSMATIALVLGIVGIYYVTRSSKK